MKLLLSLFALLLICGAYVFVERFGNYCLSPGLQRVSNNLASEANGGAVIFYSSEYTPGWEARNLIDGDYAKGWGSKSELAKGQWVELILPGTKPEIIREIRINPGPTIGNLPPFGLKNFHVDVSIDEAKYTTVLRGSFNLKELNKTKSFIINPTLARNVRIIVDDNQYPLITQYVDIAELEVYPCKTSTALKMYYQKEFPGLTSKISALTNDLSFYIKSLSGQTDARNKLSTTNQPEVGKYFRLPKETVVRANNMRRYPPYQRRLPAGAVVKIIDGPRYSEEQQWWKLSEEEWGGDAGWFELETMQSPLTPNP